MENKEIKEILENHKKWLKGSAGGIRADFRWANLSGADFREENLSGADFSGADFRWANFSGANLSGAYFSMADFRWANFSMADLSGAYFSEANFSGANFSGADFRGANFSGAYFSGADFRWANLSGADFREENLSGANFSGADFSGADLSDTNLEVTKINFPIACPEKGTFIGFKKSAEGYIVEIEITEDAKRSSATTRKCRCSKARVIGISTIEGEPKSEAKSKHDSTFIYRVGEIVEVKDFDENRWNGCSTGIHFFITRQEAIDY